MNKRDVDYQHDTIQLTKQHDQLINYTGTLFGIRSNIYFDDQSLEYCHFLLHAIEFFIL